MEVKTCPHEFGEEVDKKNPCEINEDDFYDAHEELEHSLIAIHQLPHNTSTGTAVVEIEKPPAENCTSLDSSVPCNNEDGQKDLEKRNVDPLESNIIPDGTPTDSNSDVFVLKNKDTGEVFDIREMDNSTSEGLNLFSDYFVDSTTKNQEAKGQKSLNRRSSLSKIKKKFQKMKGSDCSSNLIRVSGNKKDRRDFEEVYLAQTINHNEGPIWAMSFSYDGIRLATGGQDKILRIYKVESATPRKNSTESSEDSIPPLFAKDIEQEYEGHTASIIDISWSRSNFILSSSMDKTVRMWHVFRKECLSVFQHPDHVPAVDFHPKEDRYFLSACFDNKLRIWDIPKNRVVSYTRTPSMITSCSFNPSGNRVVAGLINGQCFFYQMDTRNNAQLKYYTQIECRNNHGPERHGKKVTGITFDPEGKSFLVTTNDSRLRLYSTDNYSRIIKYKGLLNQNLQIKASFSQDGDYIICGSENGHVYIWDASSKSFSSKGLLSSSKSDRNDQYEHFNAINGTQGIVTAALFAPASTFALTQTENSRRMSDVHAKASTQYILTASYTGVVSVFSKSPN